jgi:hypothetical protein
MMSSRPSGRASPSLSASDPRAVRAWTEPMTVHPLRDGRYVVETAGGTYVVDLEARSCDCPDHRIRNRRCKHIRRVAIEVTEGETPAPDQRVGACAVCGWPVLVPLRDAGPHLCPDHQRRPGSLVRDRETGDLLVVVGTTGERADEHRTDGGRLVADYATNADYGGQEPAIRAVYLDALDASTRLVDASRYAFPASRLVPVEPRRLTET